MTRMLATQGVEQQTLTKDDDGTSLYAAAIVQLLVPSHAYEPLVGGLQSVTDVEGSPNTVVRSLSTRYPWDAELIGREVLPTCKLSSADQQSYWDIVLQLQSRDSDSKDIRTRSHRRSQPRFRIGNLVDLEDVQGVGQVHLVVGLQKISLEGQSGLDLSITMAELTRSYCLAATTRRDLATGAHLDELQLQNAGGVTKHFVFHLVRSLALPEPLKSY